MHYLDESHILLFLVQVFILMGCARALGELFRKWGLPPSLVDAAQYHHNPSEAETSPVHACVVHLADIIAYTMKLGTGGELTPPDPDPEAVRRVGLQREALKEIQSQVKKEVDELLALFTQS